MSSGPSAALITRSGDGLGSLRGDRFDPRLWPRGRTVTAGAIATLALIEGLGLLGVFVHGVVAPDRTAAMYAMAVVGSLEAVPGPRIRFRGLDAEGLAVSNVELHAPTLDDVFLAKTGRSLGGAHEDAEPEDGDVLRNLSGVVGVPGPVAGE